MLKIFQRFYDGCLFFEFSLYFVHSKKLIYMILKLKKILNDVIYASLFYFVSYVSSISTYVIDPAARLKSGRALKGREGSKKRTIE